MLDELKKRYYDRVISSEDYDAAKEAILAEIRKNPAVSEPDKNQPLIPQ
jgi:hypothetical protein